MIQDYQLWQEYKEKGSEEARQKIILQYLDLVRYHAGRVKMMVADHVDLEDLESYGVIGLLDAINKFNYRQGVEFKTYASLRIRGEILDHLRKLDWLPHSLRTEIKRLQAKAEELKKRTGQLPDLEELAQALGMSPNKLRALYYQFYSSQWVSLYEHLSEDTRILDVLPERSSEQPAEQYQIKQREKLLAEAIERLPAQERLVISLYYYEELTQKEIAQVMEVSAARVSQLHKKAVFRLRGILGRKKGELMGKEA